MRGLTNFDDPEHATPPHGVDRLHRLPRRFGSSVEVASTLSKGGH
jgi:hypothetical protein